MLELYQFEDCPYCSKVRRKLCDLGIDFVARIVPKDRNLRYKVEEISGQRSVPILIDPNNNRVISDSEHIIEYLGRNFG